MKKYVLIAALFGGVAISSPAQQANGGVPVGPTGEMAAPNYATKGLSPRRSLPPQPPDAPAVFFLAISPISVSAGEGKIAFESVRDGNSEIYVMNPDGSTPTNLTNNPAPDFRPSFSPDGTRIAFTRGSNGNFEIRAMNADGSNQIRLTTNAAGNGSSISSGGRIAFTSARDSGNVEIYVMNADGSNQTRLTTDPAIDRDPAFSPDGTRIAFTSFREGDVEKIFVMNADGSNQIKLVDDPGPNFHPSFSPDGARIVFAADHMSNGNSEIYVTNANGSGETRLTNNSASDLRPTFSPDGARVAFSSIRDGNFEIYVMNADGSNQTNLTQNSARDADPSWGIAATIIPTPTPTATPGQNTPPGNNVNVQAPSGDASVVFAQVTAGGTTTFTSIDPASAGQLPAGYQLSPESRALDITTTATVAAPIDVSFSFPSIINSATFASLRILHGESGSLVDHTFQHDFASKTIRARVSSLSPFVVAQATAAPNRLLNVATRLRVETGDNVLIAGFIITGTDQKQVIIRGIGPSLAGFGVPDALPNTTLQLYQGGTLLAENDNWKDTQQAAIEATGLPPSSDLESAIVQTLSPGAYTAILRGKDNATGIGVVEAYDLSPAANAKLANISTRGFVSTGDTVLIGGFIVGSTSGTPAAVVVRAIGPSLSGAGVSGALQNPTLDLYNGSGTAVASNDNWKATQQIEIAGTGLPPNDDRESAIVATLASGNYTAIVRGAGNTTGVGLVEVYYLQ